MKEKTNLRYSPINKKAIRKYKKVNILNVPLTCCSFIDILGEMENVIHKKLIGNYISITNTEEKCLGIISRGCMVLIL